MAAIKAKAPRRFTISRSDDLGRIDTLLASTTDALACSYADRILGGYVWFCSTLATHTHEQRIEACLLLERLLAPTCESLYGTLLSADVTSKLDKLRVQLTDTVPAWAKGIAAMADTILHPDITVFYDAILTADPPSLVDPAHHALLSLHWTSAVSYCTATLRAMCIDALRGATIPMLSDSHTRLLVDSIDVWRQELTVGPPLLPHWSHHRVSHTPQSHHIAPATNPPPALSLSLSLSLCRCRPFGGACVTLDTGLTQTFR